MKKILIIGILVIGTVAGYRLISEKFDQIDSSMSGQEKAHVAERHGVVGHDIGQPDNPKSPPPAPPSPAAPPAAPGAAPAKPVASGPCVAPTAKPNEVVCTRDMDAFNPAKPSEKGKFLKGSHLTIGATDATTGMISVTFKDENGNVVRALCLPKDLGR